MLPKLVPAETKVLITYYSRSGNTREIANQIHKSVGGDIIELQTVEPYPDDYDAVTKQAKQELNSGYKPALKTKVENIGSYDVIFVGTPNWWGTIAAPVKTFLSEYDLSGKTIVPFITHGGSGLGRSVTDISKLCPKSTLLDGIAVWGRDVKTAQNEVSEWLQNKGRQHSPFAPFPLQELHRYYRMIRPLQGHRYFPPSWAYTYRVFSSHPVKGSHVPHESPNQARANCTPGATQAVSRSPLSSSWK